MKKIFCLAAMAIGASLIVGAASCSSDDAEDWVKPEEKGSIVSDAEAGGKILIAFTAGCGDSEASLQKTMYGEKSGASASTPVLWVSGDEFSIFPDDGNCANEKGTAGNFSPDFKKCEITSQTTTAQGYFALYPYSAQATYGSGKFSSIEIPSAQTVKAGQFDPKADLMVAYADGEEKDFKFQHIGAKLGITIPNGLSGVQSIILSCSQIIAGEAEVAFSSSSLAPAASIKGGVRYITLTCGDNSGFQPGKTYYACLLPTSEKTSIKIAFYTNTGRTEGKIARGSIDKMERATRSTAAPGYDKLHGMPIVCLKSLTDLIPSGYDGKIVFGYLNEQDDAVRTSAGEVSGLDGIFSYHDKANGTFYILSDDEICVSRASWQEGEFTGSIAAIDFSNFNTANMTSMESMFNKCSSLASLDLSGFNTENVTSMVSMFEECSSLTSLDLTSFNTEKVTSMISMFQYCSSLTSLDLTSFNTNAVTEMNNIFSGCSLLTAVYVSAENFKIPTGQRGMYRDCPIGNDSGLTRI